MLSQKKMILQHLHSGKALTPLEALDKFRCMRLSAVIFDLKKEGHHIITKTVYNRGSGKSYASYRLIPRNIQKAKHLEY